RTAAARTPAAARARTPGTAWPPPASGRGGCGASARAPRVIEGLAQAPVDLMCVQEFWLDEHWQQLTTAAAARWPHSHRGPTQTVATRCQASELAPLQACARQRCAGQGSDTLASCVVAGCAAMASKLGAGCLDCLIERPLGSIDEITGRCQAGAPVAPVSKPAGGKPRPAAGPGAKVPTAYGGSSGTGLLSSAPLTDRDVLEFPATLSKRGALYARMIRPEGPSLHVFCAHLDTGEREQRQQLDQLLGWVGQKTADGAPVLLLGDMNTGPTLASAGVRARHPAHFERLQQAGFRSVYAEQPGARCTFCDGNPLNGGAGGDQGTLIDHVLVRGSLVGAGAERLLREAISVPVGGQPLRTAPSDHYGLTATIGDAGGAG
ncbi:MAG: hypothetical protein EOO75_10695, partial [Myxococcales bacterium]